MNVQPGPRQVVVALALMFSHGALHASEHAHLILRCVHADGGHLFNGESEIILRRVEHTVTVTGASAEPESSEDIWTYRVVFESDPTGFRAIRASKPEGGEGALDFVLGGELFYVIEKNARRVEVSALNAASGSASFERFRCKDAL